MPGKKDAHAELNLWFDDACMSAKQRAGQISAALSEGRLTAEALLAFEGTRAGTALNTCLDGLELATQVSPQLVDMATFGLLCDALDHERPGIRREAARIIGNVARQPPGPMDAALAGLLRNATHEGTVVRWSAAFALGEMVSHQPDLADALLPTLRRLRDGEENSGIRKLYIKAVGDA